MLLLLVERKIGVTCQFNAPWSSPEKTLIVLGAKDINKNEHAKCKKSTRSYFTSYYTN